MPPAEENPSEENPSEENAADEPRESHIHTEEAKQRQVSHWDLDYLPSEEIERRVAEGKAAGDDDESEDEAS